jgi:glutamate-5-semialdehyde dehydrogenase
LSVSAEIYESLPNVTLHVASLALKTGNAVVLRGGSGTVYSNRALVEVIHQALSVSGLPKSVVHFIDNPDREYASQLNKMYEWIDMLIPHGDAGLHKYCREKSTFL